MMNKVINFLTSLIAQIILAVIIVLVLIFINPWNIFTQSEETLKDTPLLVRSMKEIGQLITAEYYGETVADNFTVLELTDSQMDEETEEVLALHKEFYRIIDSLAMPRKRLWEFTIRKIFESNYRDLIYHPDFADLKEVYIKRSINNKIKRKFYRYHLDLALAGKLKAESAKIEKNLKPDLIEIYGNDNSVPDKIKKKEILVMVGRGWVKAGFDFKEFEPDNFFYNEDEKRIYLAGMKPFLEVSMNPWFIPEKGVEGFEFVLVGNQVEHDRDIVLETKRKCAAKLLRQAEDREILKIAKENAEKNLRQFFSLMMDTDIEGVTLGESKIDIYEELFKSNDTISLDELALIEKEFLKESFEGQELPKRRIIEFRKYEKLINWIRDSSEIGYPKSAFIEDLIDDNFLEFSELLKLKESKINNFDKLWYQQFFIDSSYKSGELVYSFRYGSISQENKDSISGKAKKELLSKVNGVEIKFEDRDTSQVVIDKAGIKNTIEAYWPKWQNGVNEVLPSYRDSDTFQYVPKIIRDHEYIKFIKNQ